ncbi:MAG: DUF3800 domain-containing protein [Bacteroidota bacterium]
MADKPLYHIYCDESRQSKDRYMVLGGIVMEHTEILRFADTMKKFRQEQKMTAELKWSKVSTQKLPEYKRFVDYFFALNNTNYIHFHSIIIDNHQVNHKKFNKGDKELGFYKFFYQLLLHCFGKIYCTSTNNVRLFVHLDNRQTKYKLSTLKTILNNGMAKKFSILYRPFVAVEPVESKISDLLQISDIILGAMGYQKNGYHLLAESKKGKIELAEYIASSAGLKTLTENTLKSNQRFTIWNFRLQQ